MSVNEYNKDICHCYFCQFILFVGIRSAIYPVFFSFIFEDCTKLSIPSYHIYTNMAANLKFPKVKSSCAYTE